MEFGQFSVSLAVKDIQSSFDFYSKLGFTSLEGLGSLEEKWLILQKGSVTIGLFQDMFENNIFTFNPEDARSIEKELLAAGLQIDTPTKGDSGPAHFILRDPDGNTIMFDQHV